jgi:hypothetical protein
MVPLVVGSVLVRNYPVRTSLRAAFTTEDTEGNSKGTEERN